MGSVIMTQKFRLLGRIETLDVNKRYLLKAFLVFWGILFLLTPGSVTARNAVSPEWDGLFDIAYQFTWYPKKSIQELVDQKSIAYDQPLTDYTGLLIFELTGEDKTAAALTPEDFAGVSGKPWRMYTRLAVSQFCLYILTENETHLENARNVISVLSAKKELFEVAFWYYLFEAHAYLIQNDRNGFVNAVFKVWQDVILKLEAQNILMESPLGQNLSHLYENIAHLIITEAIIGRMMPDLHPLSVIIMTLKDKLTNENGYKNLVDPIVERMVNLKSDNYNLNFAVSFVQATANQYAFEDERSAADIVEKYNQTKLFYDLSWSWADTDKGRAALMTQYMGFMNFSVRRLMDKDPALVHHSFFNTLPEESHALVKKGVALFDTLADKGVIARSFQDKGFGKETNYLKAAHQLWDAIAKLMFILSGYYKSVGDPGKVEHLSPMAGPLLEYMTLFHQFIREDAPIVPDNAFFLASYAAGELADIYRQAANFTKTIAYNDLALAYQLLSVEIFPLDVTGIMHLSDQANSEGRVYLYFQYVKPVAARLKTSEVAKTWPEDHPTPYRQELAAIQNIIPGIIDNASFLIQFFRYSNDSPGKIAEKAIMMAQLLPHIKDRLPEELVEGVLSTIAGLDFENSALPPGELLKSVLPEDLHADLASAPNLDDPYDIARMRNELYGALDIPLHTYFRKLFYETPFNEHQYLKLLQKASKK